MSPTKNKTCMKGWPAISRIIDLGPFSVIWEYSKKMSHFILQFFKKYKKCSEIPPSSNFNFKINFLSICHLSIVIVKVAKTICHSDDSFKKCHSLLSCSQLFWWEQQWGRLLQTPHFLEWLILVHDMQPWQNLINVLKRTFYCNAS